jgi:hypothetical protein
VTSGDVPYDSPECLTLVLNLVILGLAITLEPIPFTAFIVVLASKDGAPKAGFFIAGWILSLAIVVAGTLVATENNPPKSNSVPSTAQSAVKILIGGVLLVIALRWRHMIGKPKKPKDPPKWQSGVDAMSGWFALALGPLTQPWGLVAAGVAVIAGAKLNNVQNSLPLILLCLLATGTYLIAEIYAWVRPEPTRTLLVRLRAWITTHTDQVIMILSGVVGAWLIVNSAYLLIG